MRFNSPQYPYLVKRDIDILNLLNILQKNKNTVAVVVVNNDLSIYGVLSKGDLIDYISLHPKINLLDMKAEDIANKFPVIGHIDDSIETITKYLEPDNIKLLPILDHKRRVIKIITKEKPSFKIKETIITENSKPYLIAEIGVNHNGDLNEAIFLINCASEAGCDAVKFQYRSEKTYSRENIDTYDLGTQYILSELARTRLTIEEIKACGDLVNNLDMDLIITPFDKIALDQIMEKNINLSALKIASCDLTNLDLIEHCTKTGLPIILSTGMSFEREIILTSQYLRKLMVEHAFLHCNSTYPSPTEDINLKYINRLQNITQTIVGFSSHDGDAIVPLGSISQGAKIVEFHITRSIKSSGTDHRASIETKDIKKLVENSILLHMALGESKPRVPSQGELSNRLSLGKSLALNKNMKKGEEIKKENLILLSPGSGLGLDYTEKILGKKLNKNYSANTLLKKSDFEESNYNGNDKLCFSINNLEKKGYQIGIPVRYHDAVNLNNLFNIKMLEFHMSDRDLNIDPKKYLSDELVNIDLIVHAVEQYEDGFILDLASNDNSILARSYEELDRLFKHVDQLRKFFNPKIKIPIVLNMGGFTNDGFLSDEEYSFSLERAINELHKINAIYNGYLIIPQTMPPFPWHQGGRSYHNLLTNLNKVRDFLSMIDNSLCLDISHTALSCAYFKENIEDHIETIGERIFHIHLSDAQGQNAEGLEVGSGNLDFNLIHKTIKKYKNEVYLIPEIWQGHLYEGEAFKRSLIRYFDLID